MSGISDPRNLNPFSYAANNPLRYTDPTGHMICEVCGGEGGDFPNGYGYYPPPPPSSGGSTNTPTPTSPPTPTNTPTKTPTNTPTTTPTPTSTPIATATPLCTSPSNLCATIVAGQATYVAGQPTYTAWQCQNYSCFGIPPLTATPTKALYVGNEPFPWENVKPSNPFVPSITPNIDEFWNSLGNALPLLSIPATNLSKIVIDAYNIATNVTQTISNAFANMGTVVGEAIGNTPGFGPVMPLFFYAPSADPFAPVYQ